MPTYQSEYLTMALLSSRIGNRWGRLFAASPISSRGPTLARELEVHGAERVHRDVAARPGATRQRRYGAARCVSMSRCLRGTFRYSNVYGQVRQFSKKR